MCADKNRVVAVLTSNSIHPVRGLPSELRKVTEGMIEFALATIWDHQFEFNRDRAAPFVARYGHQVEPVLEYQFERRESRAAFIKYCTQRTTLGRRSKFIRVIQAEVVAALPLKSARVYQFRHGDAGASERPQCLGGRILSARTLYDTTYGCETHTERPVGKPTYVPESDRAELDMLWPDPPSAVAPAPVASSSTATKTEGVHMSDWELEDQFDDDEALEDDKVLEGEDDSDAEGESASEAPVAPRPRTRAAKAAASSRAQSAAQSHPPAPAEVPRKRPRQDDVLRDTLSPSLVRAGYIGAPPPHLRRAISARGSLRVAPPMAPSRSEGSVTSQSGWGLSGLALGDTASSSSSVPARAVRTPVQDPFSGVTDPLRLRTLALARWDVLNQHVTHLETLASEIERIALQEEEQTGRPFGSTIADSRNVGERGFMPHGGANDLADLPTLSRSYLRATSEVYRSARATPSPDVEMGDASAPGPGGDIDFGEFDFGGPAA